MLIIWPLLLLINNNILVTVVWSKTLPIINLLEKKSWPSTMQQFDIWGTKHSMLNNQSKLQPFDAINKNVTTDNNLQLNQPKLLNLNTNLINLNNNRQSKVLNFFPVPVAEECQSNDGRRFGTCLNIYECRKKGGQGKGECALGFGVCCIFIASCDQEIVMNNTYLVSPNFPSFMRNNLTECKVKIKMMATDISQLRIDFHHMILGQPNRKTGICDGDVFEITGGPTGKFHICGQNSGQHVYYDVDGISSRQTPLPLPTVATKPPNDDTPLTSTTTTKNPFDLENINENLAADTTVPIIEQNVEIAIKFASRVIQTRFWEIRIMQIPFSQRAPTGCLQFFHNLEGIIQTFNFAENGRHLANQNYKSCIRQERGMCSIIYEPCDENSFRIGPAHAAQLNDVASPAGGGTETITAVPATMVTPTVQTYSGIGTNQTSVPIQGDSQQSPDTDTAASNPDAVIAEDETVEGSGDDSGINLNQTPTPAPPVRGGFDILSFFRSTFFDTSTDDDDDDDARNARNARNARITGNTGRRQGRQFNSVPNFFSQCTDRITMPCIVEDFIADGDGMSRFLGCEPVHCGMKFCATSGAGSSSSSSCRIESTVTPFYIGVHFGDGSGKGSPEENIGSCLKFNQMPCI